MTEIHAYKDHMTGETYAFAGPRPDLDALANWEKVEVKDVPDELVDAVAAQSHTARVITEAAKPRDDAATSDASGMVAVRVTDPVPTVPAGAFGGVLSRNVVAGTPQEVLRAQAVADAESLATHGTLAANADGSQTRVRAEGMNAEIVNAPPVGDVSKSPHVQKARKAAENATKRAQDRNTAAENAAAEKAAARRTG